MEKSATISELAKALVNFQTKVKTIGYDANNPFFKSRYATLTALVKETKVELSAAGLAVSQLIEDEGAVITILMHTSGEFISSKVYLKPVKDDPQGRGSSITYARRYSYAAILGLVSDEDDDANAASHNGKSLEYISEKEAGIIRDLLISLEKSEDKFLGYMGIKSLETMPKSDLQKAMAALEMAKKRTVK